MRQWMVAAKKADFYAIAEKFHVDPVVARIIRNREVIGEENIRIYLGGNLSDLSDPHQMKDMDRLVDILGQKIRRQGTCPRLRIFASYLKIRHGMCYFSSIEINSSEEISPFLYFERAS